jgi:hypothetical protein
MNNLESTTETAHYMETKNSDGSSLQDSSYNLKNIFTDPVVDYSKISSDPHQDSTVDIFSNTIQLPMVIDQISSDKIRVQEEYLDANGATQYRVVDIKNNEICMANKIGSYVNGNWVDTKIASVSQLHATSEIDIAPYYYKGLMPTITCTPKNLTYVQDDSSTTVIWLPNRVIYSSSYVDSVVKTNDIVTGRKGTATRTSRKRVFDASDRGWTWETTTETNSLYANGWHGANLWNNDYTTVDSTTYDYKTTGASYTSTVVGEEVVETTKTAVKNIAQPYMKAGQTVRISGQDFDPGTEIRFYLDDNVVTPEFNNTRYPEDGTNRAFTQTSDSSGVSYDMTFNTITTGVSTTIYRPWQWEFSKDTTNNDLWKLSHPKDSDGNCIDYFYNESTDSWYYSLINKNSKNSQTPVALSDTPKWAKYISRSIWLRNYINTLTDSDIKAQWNKYNNLNPVTGEAYTDSAGYSNSKITVITDTDGRFEIDIAIPENTPTGSHTIKAETVLPLYIYTDSSGVEHRDINSDYSKYATDSFTGSSFLRHWDTAIYKRQIELVKETVYRDVTVTRYETQYG